MQPAAVCVVGSPLSSCTAILLVRQNTYSNRWTFVYLNLLRTHAQGLGVFATGNRRPVRRWEPDLLVTDHRRPTVRCVRQGGRGFEQVPSSTHSSHRTSGLGGIYKIPRCVTGGVFPREFSLAGSCNDTFSAQADDGRVDGGVCSDYADGVAWREE
jgi:hypothetical protein